jgi:hypothetical protein
MRKEEGKLSLFSDNMIFCNHLFLETESCFVVQAGFELNFVSLASLKLIILLPPPPKFLGLQVYTILPS